MRLFFFLLIFTCLDTAMAQYPEVNWRYDVDDMAFGNTAAADIDSDGKLELVFGAYRNDGHVYALNAEDGSLLWKYDTGGCNDVAPLVFDVDSDGELEVVVPSSCVPKTFCLNGLNGVPEWTANTRGSDSPPTLGDVDNDGKPEIIHGEFGGYLICFNAEDGSLAWEIAVDTNSWIQTAPALMDIKNDGQLDFVVANWSFGEDYKIVAYNGLTHEIIWESGLPDGNFYHGASFADLDGDGRDELCIGSYDGSVYVLNSEDGSLAWSFSFGFDYSYVAAPTSIADINNDNKLDIVFFDSYIVGALSAEGNLLWRYDIPDFASSFRGAALADVNGDDSLDVIFGTSDGHLMALSGGNGMEFINIDLRDHSGKDDFEIDHGPVIADFDDDGDLDAFIVGGHAEYPAIENNYGRAYSVSIGPGDGPAWLMFRRDLVRSGCLNNTSPTGMTEIDRNEPELKIFPNPGDGLFTIRSSGIERIKVFDIFGRMIFEEDYDAGKSIENIIDLSQTPTAVYYVFGYIGAESIVKMLQKY